MDNIELIKKVFVDQEPDESERIDNAQRIEEWSKILIENENLLSWQQHEYTQTIYKEFRKEYKYIGLQLATDRDMTQEQRQSLWHKQDALILMMSLMKSDRNPQQEINAIELEIKAAIDLANAT